MDSFSPPSPETVRIWAAAEEQALERVRTKIRALQAEEATLVVRLKALRDMLGTFGPTPTNAAPETGAAPTATSPTGAPRLAEAPGEHVLKIADGHRGSVGFRVRTQVAEILAERSEPMHINDIWAEFKSRGWAIPGRGNAANITAHLTGSVEILSPSRGYYALAKSAGAFSGKTTTSTAQTGKTRSSSATSSQGNR